MGHTGTTQVKTDAVTQFDFKCYRGEALYLRLESIYCTFRFSKWLISHVKTEEIDKIFVEVKTVFVVAVAAPFRTETFLFSFLEIVIHLMYINV